METVERKSNDLRNGENETPYFESSQGKAAIHPKVNSRGGSRKVWAWRIRHQSQCKWACLFLEKWLGVRAERTNAKNWKLQGQSMGFLRLGWSFLRDPPPSLLSTPQPARGVFLYSVRLSSTVPPCGRKMEQQERKSHPLLCLHWTVKA